MTVGRRARVFHCCRSSGWRSLKLAALSRQCCAAMSATAACSRFAPFGGSTEQIRSIKISPASSICSRRELFENLAPIVGVGGSRARVPDRARDSTAGRRCAGTVCRRPRETADRRRLPVGKGVATWRQSCESCRSRRARDFAMPPARGDRSRLLRVGSVPIKRFNLLLQFLLRLPRSARFEVPPRR